MRSAGALQRSKTLDGPRAPSAHPRTTSDRHLPGGRCPKGAAPPAWQRSTTVRLSHRRRRPSGRGRERVCASRPRSRSRAPISELRRDEGARQSLFSPIDTTSPLDGIGSIFVMNASLGEPPLSGGRVHLPHVPGLSLLVGESSVGQTGSCGVGFSPLAAKILPARRAVIFLLISAYGFVRLFASRAAVAIAFWPRLSRYRIRKV